MALERRQNEELPYEEAYNRVLEKVIPHELHPDLFPAPRLTQEELALLWSNGDPNKVVTKMAVCKFEAKTLEKIKKALTKKCPDIKSVSDVFETDADRETAKKWTGSSDY